jgi:hypothetical protein
VFRNEHSHERWLRLTRRRYARHPLFTCGGKRGLNIDYQSVINMQVIYFQAPLYGEAEERVAGVASPGEYSPPQIGTLDGSKFEISLC